MCLQLEGRGELGEGKVRVLEELANDERPGERAAVVLDCRMDEALLYVFGSFFAWSIEVNPNMEEWCQINRGTGFVEGRGRDFEACPRARRYRTKIRVSCNDQLF